MIKFDTTRVLGAFNTFTYFPPPASPDIAQYDSSQLRNEYDDLMYIDEIRFYGWSPSAAIANGTYDQIDQFSEFKVEIKTQRHQMMKEPIYLSMLAPDGISSLEMPANDIVFQRPGQYTKALNPMPFAYRAWRPPDPIILPPGDAIQVRMFDEPVPLTGVDSNDFQIWVVLVGRVSRDKAPRSARYPYIISYAPDGTPATPLLTTPYQTQVTPYVLKNPFMQPLNVQRMILRGYETGGGGVVANTLLVNPDMFDARVRDSNQKDVTPSGLIPAGVLIDSRTSSWTFVRDIPPDGYMNVVLQKEFGYDPATVWPRVSFICSREEIV